MKHHIEPARAISTDSETTDSSTSEWRQRIRQQGPPPPKVKALFQTEYAELGIASDSRFYVLTTEGVLILHHSQRDLIAFCVALTLSEQVAVLWRDSNDTPVDPLFDLEAAGHVLDEAESSADSTVMKAMIDLIEDGAQYWASVIGYSIEEKQAA